MLNRHKLALDLSTLQEFWGFAIDTGCSQILASQIQGQETQDVIHRDIYTSYSSMRHPDISFGFSGREVGFVEASFGSSCDYFYRDHL